VHVSISFTYILGDWAGNSYATSGCPGTCPQQLMDPNNFVVSILHLCCPSFCNDFIECIMEHQFSQSLQETTLCSSQRGFQSI
jgi:hypothetical protein